MVYVWLGVLFDVCLHGFSVWYFSVVGVCVLVLFIGVFVFGVVV